MIDIVRKVHRFNNALRQAIYDRELEEQGEALHFFFDADVVLGTIVGLTSFDTRTAPDVSSLTYVIRALLSTGYIPPIRLLSPHLVEFDQTIRRLQVPKLQHGFQQKLRKTLIHHWGIAESDAALRKIMKTTNGLFEFLQEHGYGVFVKLELCMGGTWHTRLARMMRGGLLRLRSDGEFGIPNPHDPNLEVFVSTLSNLRPQFPLNNLNDAYALAELVGKHARGVHARFYTQSLPVRHTLSEFAPESADSSETMSIQREEEYFLLRCSFPALEFAHMRLHAGSTALIGLHEWKQLCSQLGDLLLSLRQPGHDGDASFHHALYATGVGGIGLGDLIERFYNLGFLDSVFLTWTPERMEEWLPSLSHAKSDSALVSAVSQRLRQSLDELWSKVDHEVEKVRNWQEVLRRVLAASETRARTLEGRQPSLDLDLGLGRWGIPQLLDPGTIVLLETAISSLLNEDKRAVTAGELAISISSPVSNLQIMAMNVCLLWFLRLDELIIHIFTDARRNRSTGNIPAWLTLFESLALVRTADRRGRPHQEELSNIIKQTANAIATEPDPAWNKGFALMGMAHVYYLAWRTLKPYDPSDVAYARQSFDAARSAYAHFVNGSLEWAFAVNHCAYIGIESGLYPEETARFAQMLAQSLPQFHNHYRFVDTVVRVQTHRTVKEVEHHGIKALTSPHFKGLRRRLCDEFAHASVRLREHSSCGDEEILEHIALIESYRSLLQC